MAMVEDAAVEDAVVVAVEDKSFGVLIGCTGCTRLCLPRLMHYFSFPFFCFFLGFGDYL